MRELQNAETFLILFKMKALIIELRLWFAEWLMAKASEIAPKDRKGDAIRYTVYDYFNDLIL